MPVLSHITIFPIKSLDGIALEQATIAPGGALIGDREFAIVDAAGEYVNGKRTAQVHALRAQYDLTQRLVTLWVDPTGNTQPTGDRTTFHLDQQRPELAGWLTRYFGFQVQLIQDTHTGFPDDPASPGPTIISTATLKMLTTWFPGIDLAAMRHRFRTNLEITDVEPFWEEHLYAEADRPVPFHIGSVQLHGINPCQRCIVPVRDAYTGTPYPNFQKTFQTQRKAFLPAWAERSRFNHFYRLAINTRIPTSEMDKTLCIGDSLYLDSAKPA
jgi:hypothetical protein